MADKVSKEQVEKVAQHLEKYAQDSQLVTLENLARVALFQDRAAADKTKQGSGTPPAAQPGTKLEQLQRALAASVGLGKA